MMIFMASAGRAKAMMAERLAASEAKLLKLSHEDVVQTLVETKMTLAQSEFQALSLQVGACNLDVRRILLFLQPCFIRRGCWVLLQLYRQLLYDNSSRKLACITVPASVHTCISLAHHQQPCNGLLHYC